MKVNQNVKILTQNFPDPFSEINEELALRQQNVGDNTLHSGLIGLPRESLMHV